MAEADTRKPELLADWRISMNSYRYMLVQIYSFEPVLIYTDLHIPRDVCTARR